MVRDVLESDEKDFVGNRENSWVLIVLNTVSQLS